MSPTAYAPRNRLRCGPTGTSPRHKVPNRRSNRFVKTDTCAFHRLEYRVRHGLVQDYFVKKPGGRRQGQEGS
jgi:hypothetical protein